MRRTVWLLCAAVMAAGWMPPSAGHADGSEPHLWSRVIEGGTGIDLAVGAEGYPIMSYVDSRGRAVMAACLDPECGDVATTIVSEGPVTQTAIELGRDGWRDGFPLVAYVEYEAYPDAEPDCAVCGEWWLRLLRCDDDLCTTGSVQTLHRYYWDGTLAYQPEIALRGDGTPFVSVEEHWNLRVFACLDQRCDRYRGNYLGRGGEHAALAVARRPRPMLASINRGVDYQNPPPPPGLDLFECVGRACTGRSIVQVDPDAWFGRGPAVAADAGGNPMVSYLTEDHGLRLARCLDQDCRDVDLITVDPAGWAAPGAPRPDTALVLDSAGHPIIAYVTHLTDRGMNLLRCLTDDCSVHEGPIHLADRIREIEMVPGPGRSVYVLYQTLEEPPGDTPASLTIARFRYPFHLEAASG